MQELLKQAGGSFSLSQFAPPVARDANGPAGYTVWMLKGSKKAVITKIQPVSIHGQVSLDIFFLDPDDPQGQASRARVGEESVPRSLEAGDHVELHYVLGVVTHITKP
jgi:hypothetical protein